MKRRDLYRDRAVFFCGGAARFDALRSRALRSCAIRSVVLSCVTGRGPWARIGRHNADMSWSAIVSANLTTVAVGVLIVVVSFNRLLRVLWLGALMMPLVPIFAVAYSGYPDGVYLWSYLPIGLAVYVRRKIGSFPRHPG